MRRSALFALVVIAACSSPKPKPDPSMVGSAEPTVETKSGLLWYLIQFDDERAEQNQMTVRVRLHQPLEKTRFYLPAQWAGRDDWSKRLSVVQADGPNGPRFMTIDRDQGVVEIDARDQPWIELTYRVALRNGDRLFSQFENGNVTAFVPTFAVLPAAQVLENLVDIPIEVHTPENWTVSSTWPLEKTRSSLTEGRTVWGFVAKNASELNDAFFTAGPNLVSLGDETLQMIVPTQHADTYATLFSPTKEIIKHYRAKFGDVGPAKMFVRTHGASDHTEYVGMGRRGGFVVELDPKKPIDDNVRLLVAHEALHLWNGHWLVPHPEHEAETRWFKEGITHYLALKTVSKLGLVAPQFTLDELAFASKNYISNRAISGGGALRDIDTIRLPYDQGTLFGVLIDGMLEAQSKPQLETWLGHIAVDAHSQHPGYDISSLHSALEATSNGDPDIHAAWTAHIIESKPLDPRVVFAKIDLHWLPPRLNQSAKLVALDRKNPVYVRLWSDTK